MREEDFKSGVECIAYHQAGRYEGILRKVGMEPMYFIPDDGEEFKFYVSRQQCRLLPKKKKKLTFDQARIEEAWDKGLVALEMEVDSTGIYPKANESTMVQFICEYLACPQIGRAHV